MRNFDTLQFVTETIVLNGQPVWYTLRVNTRAKRVRVVVKHDGSVYLTIPRERHRNAGQALMEKHAGWILRTIEKNKNNPSALPRLTRRGYQKHKEEARKYIEARLAFCNQHYRFSYNRVSIRNQKSRWGSCSKKKNLNFNYRLLFLPPELCDYVVVHELCHLKEMNHGPRFWALVAKTFPNYRVLRRELVKIGLQIG